MKTLLNEQSPVTDAALKVVAHMPTRSLPALIDGAFTNALTDADYMRIAVWLARKSYDEGGCPIGAVIVDSITGEIRGKGHNTLVQDNDPYNHGETSAMRDAGRIDFTKTTLYTSLSPCGVCAKLISMRGFRRVVVGDATNASGTEELLREEGIQVDVLEDSQGIDLYAQFRSEKPKQDLEDWLGVSALSQFSQDK